MVLKPYIAYFVNPEEGAILVFATNIQQAKVIAFWELKDLFNGVEYIHIRAKAVKQKDSRYRYFMSLLGKDIPHFIHPPACKNPECTYWADGFDGLCEECRKNLQPIDFAREEQR